MEYKDYYQILGVGKDADDKEIKRAYRKLARAYHPDRNPNDKSAEEKFKDINEAYEVLGNPENRRKYDQLGANYHRWRQMGGARGNGNARYENINIDDLSELFGGAGGFSDFFSTIFGDQAARQRAQPLRQDSEATVEITIEEAYHGTTRVLVDSNGDRFTAKIPRGARNGTKVRLRGKGARGGDLYLTIRLLADERYQPVEGSENDLKTTISVSALTAVLGGSVRVETLKGPVNLKIMPGTQGGQTVRLRGRGMPDLRRNDMYGDLYAVVAIEIPTMLSEEERALYAQLRELERSRST